MVCELCLSSTGRLFLQSSQQDLPYELSEAFSKGNASGLVALAVMDAFPGSGAGCLFFRDIIRKFLLDILIPEMDELESNFLKERMDAHVPDHAEIQKMTESMPLFPGSAYAVCDWFSQMYHELSDYCFFKKQMSGLCLSDWIRSLSPQWKDAGKICFNLGENKDKNNAAPFVFLATYIHKISDTGQAKHMPLAMALKRYADDRTNLLRILVPLKTAQDEAPFLKKIQDDKTVFRPSFWSSKNAWNFLNECEIYRKNGILIRMTDLFKTRLPKLKVVIEMGVSGKHVHLSQSSLMKFSVNAAIGGRKLTEEELKDILNSDGGLIQVKGQWIEADQNKIASLLQKWRKAGEQANAAGISLIQCLRIFNRAGRLNGEDFPEMPNELCDVSASPDLQTLLSDLNAKKDQQIPSLPSELNALLRPYQKEGVAFLWNMTQSGFGACLADDMGLGKTIQILSWLELLRKEGTFKKCPALLVLPASLLKNWKNEAAKFTPQLKVTLLHSSEMNSHDWQEFHDEPENFLSRSDLILTTYSLLPRLNELTKITFPVIVADEAQAIKNAYSVQSMYLRSLHGSRKIAMTGTPVENSLTDLWSLFDFIVPGLLGSNSQFHDFVKEMENGTNGHADYSPLRKLVRPFILRRLKTDKSVIRDLPDKSELKVFCGLTMEQAKFYQRAVDAMKKEFDMTDELHRSGIILSYLLKFKQICNHPSQFSGNGIYDMEKSGKFMELNRLAKKIAVRGEKMLVFTQFREMTEHLHDLLSDCFQKTGLILHGGMSVTERAKAVSLFQQPDGPPFFVLSLKAAGTGLNLTAANHVVHFDRWWNPAVENQATDRAYRIGQHKNVLVHKFVVKGTIEEKIDAMISGKKFLSNSLLGGNAEKLLTEMTPQELLRFVSLENSAIESDSESAEERE